ncbi:unnamed protein product, partial [Meganyctiphanes norvegica]
MEKEQCGSHSKMTLEEVLLMGETTMITQQVRYGAIRLRPRDATLIQMSNLSKDNTFNMELYNSCASGNYEDVKKLLQKGAKPLTRIASENESPLYITCRNGFHGILELLFENLEANNGLISGLKFADRYGNSLFHIIMKSISKSKAKAELLDFVYYKKCMEIILKYVNHEKYDEFKFIKEKEHCLLVDACEEGLHEFVDRLLNDGADPTKYCNRTEYRFPLHIAGSNGYILIFKSIVDRLKKINKLQLGLQQKDKFGNTVLHTISKGLEKTMKSARKQLASKNEDEIRKYSENIQAFVECMSVLLPEYLDYVDVDAVNDVGNTALHTAVLLQKFHYEFRMVDLLCENGANNDIKNKVGKYAVIEKFSLIPKRRDSRLKIKSMVIKTDNQKRAEDLYDACESGNLDYVNYYVEIADCTMFLIEKQETTAIRAAFSQGYFRIVEVLIRNIKKKLDLHQVIAIIKKLSSNIKKQHESSTVSVLWHPEIDYDKCLDILVEHNHLFSDVLYAACKKGDANIVSKLLSKGVDPTLRHEQNEEFCPIFVSFKNGYYDIADILLKKTKDIGKLEEVMREDTINSIIVHVIDGGFLEKEKHRKETIKKEKNKSKSKRLSNQEAVINYGETFGVLLNYIEHFELRNKNEILYDVCEKGLPHFVKKLLDFNADPARECKNRLENYPLIIAARKGHSDILDIILSQLEENKLKQCLQERTHRYGHSVLHAILRCDKENIATDNDYIKCMEILMQKRQHFDIDAEDKNRNTALHYAVHLQGDWTFAKILIRNGACINVKNREGICAIDKIPVSTIEDILNECIEESKLSNNRESVHFGIKLDFSIFSHKESMDTRSESEFITALHKSKSHHHLLYHPLITTFIHIKWQKIRYIWYLNLLFHILFFSLIYTYIFYYGRNVIENDVIDKNKEINIFPLKIGISILGSILSLKEIVQLFIFKWDYFKNFDDCLQVSILVLIYIMLYSGSIHAQYSIAAWLVIFTTAEIILIFEQMHMLEIAIYISMFKKVTFDFVKLTALIVWMVLAFGVSFYLLFHFPSNNENLQVFENRQNETDIRTQNITAAMEEENANQFATLNEALLKTLVMTTGELDFSDFEFDSFPLTSRLIFVLFLFCIIFVACNLLNGIAISDIQVIQKDASKYLVRDQVRCIINFDRLKPWLRCLKMWKSGQMFECCFPNKVIKSIHSNTTNSTLWVRCNGHNDNYSVRLYFLRVYKWFNSILKNPKDCQCNICCCIKRNEPIKHKCKGCKQRKSVFSCNACGEEANECQECHATKQKGKHLCIYKHKYMIPPEFVVFAKQIYDQIETKDES